MWLIILTVVTAIICIISFVIFEKDVLHPDVVFNIFFLISELTCLLFAHEYEIVLHYQTVVALILGELVFLIISIFSYSTRKKARIDIIEEIIPCKIEVKKRLVKGLVFLQFVSIVFFVVYIRAISMKYTGSAGSLGSMINFYDQANKFFQKELATVPIPIAYRLSNPIGIAGGHIMLYVLINNWIAVHKVDFWHLLSVLLLVIIYVLNGSRTPIFRLITIALIIYYVLFFKRKLKKISAKFWRRLVIISIATIVIMLGMLVVTGRVNENTEYKISDFLFVYIGAPIVNLDNWLADPIILEDSFIPGAHTFPQLYSKIGDVLNNEQFHAKKILLFKTSENGKFLGNVYTMYYPYVYDFGLLGVVPLTSIMAIFYSILYDRMFVKKISSNKISLRLFYYSYLFNDLMMSIFSARFYETILNTGVIKIFIVSFFIEKLFIEEKIPIFNSNIKLSGIKIES